MTAVAVFHTDACRAVGAPYPRSADRVTCARCGEKPVPVRGTIRDFKPLTAKKGNAR